MRNFVFITDLHFALKSGTRTGDYLDDLSRKLEWVVDYCNQNSAALLLGGDQFHTPSVPDIVKARVIHSLVRCKNGVYGIRGNHEILYSNREFAEKTSFNILEEAGLITDLDKGDVEFEDVLLTSTVPFKADNRPVIGIFHGLLNTEDPGWTFKYTDIAPHANDLLVLLGHDHIHYDDLKFDDKTTIIRPGSFARDERTQDHMRTPQLVHITVDAGHLSYKYVDIASARACTDIFKAREVTISDSEKASTYAEVIAQLGNARKNQMSFAEALATVTSPDVYEYCIKLLEDKKRANQSECKHM